MSNSTYPFLLATALAIAIAPAATEAATFTVGGDAACTHASLQAAITAAQNGTHTVRVTRSAAYTAQALTISTDGTMELVGGFADCSAASDGSTTTLSGAGGATEPVLRITVATGGVVTLRNLVITGGDEDGAGYGGGIYFRGDGILQLIASSVSSNLAGYGGGIYAEGTGPNAELVVGEGVTIANNLARFSGGGIYVEGLAMTMTAPGSILAFNQAVGIGDEGGYGGGLMILGGPFESFAYIGSNGQGGLGAIYGNEARYGGGVSVVAEPEGDMDATLQLFATDLARATAIRGNFASIRGGAIYARPDIDAFPLSSTASARVMAWNMSIADNAAPSGAAVYLDYDSDVLGINRGAQLYFNALTNAPSNPGLACPLDGPCGHISGNWSTDGNGQATSGAVIRADIQAGVDVSRIEATNNRGGYLLHVSGDDGLTNGMLRDSLLHANITTAGLLRFDSSVGVAITDTTIAGNDIGAGPIIRSASNLLLQRSILWQPGVQILQQDSGTLTVENVLASEIASIGGGPAAVLATPRFIDPARGDYRLRAASHAVDFAPAVAGDDRDLHNRPRDQDVVGKANLRGVRDVGAFERPTLQPLVLNGFLDVDLNLWTVVTPGSASWSSENISGVDTGSVLVNMNPAPSADVIALTQCIHLPGPGTYALNGWGRAIGLTMASRDQLYLRWQYRPDGGEACTDGPPLGEGNHFLTSSSSWTFPAQPTHIVVSEAEWTHNSSISVSLRVRDTGLNFPNVVSGYFDGIRLELGSLPSAELLKDGFEGP